MKGSTVIIISVLLWIVTAVGFYSMVHHGTSCQFDTPYKCK